MRPGRHAAGDGSFGRSAGAAVFRGAALLAVAVILGIVLLQATDDGDPFDDEPVVADGQRPRTTSAGESDTTEAPATTVAMRQPSQVKVIAANGTDTKGLAGKYTDLLKAAGYNVLAPTDTTKKPVATTAVYFTPGFEADARAVAAALKLPAGSVQALPASPPTASAQGANVVVVLGTDVARTAAPTTARSATTTTTSTTSTTVA